MEQKLLQLLQNYKNVRQLKQTHLQIIVNGLQDSSFIVPKLMNLSFELISLDYVFRVFQTSNTPNVVAYNNMIKCFTGKTHGDALCTYHRMRLISVSPNSFTFTFLLKCLESAEALQGGKALHGHILQFGFGSNVFVQNALLDFYAKCGDTLDSARCVFEEMPERDVVSWNTMLGAYMDHGQVDNAIGLFESMPERNIVTWNSVLAGLLKAGSMELAYSVFKRMPERNEVSWNSIISGYIKAGDLKSAEAIFHEMPEKTVVSWTAMVSGYATVGDMESSRKLFDRMPVKNVISWNAMISGYVHNHMFDQALSLFHFMLIDGKCRPNQTSLISVLSACSHLGSLEHGKWIDSYIKKNKLDFSMPLGNALIDMFAKCGDIQNAKAVFSLMDKRCLITWTTIISGLAINGQCREAVEFFSRMSSEGLRPDDVIFIAVLTACTHGGLVEEGKRVYDKMVEDFDIKPRIEHYGCMVDLLSRAGKLKEAVKFIESMHLQPNAIIWATLLSACRTHRDGELLDLVTRKILDQEPSNPSYLTLITNLSSSVGRWQDALNFRVTTRRQGIEKLPGCSSIQIGNDVHEFLAKDTKHRQKKEIYRVLDNLSGHLKMLCELHCEYIQWVTAI